MPEPHPQRDLPDEEWKHVDMRVHEYKLMFVFGFIDEGDLNTHMDTHGEHGVFNHDHVFHVTIVA